MVEEGNDKEMRELYAMFHQEYVIMAEYRMLQTENLPGIYVIPSCENSFLWFGVIFVRSGFYEGGVFRFTLKLPDKFPNEEVPVLTFTPPIYHPVIDATTGILNITEVFPKWDRKINYIWQILKYLHLVFHNFTFKVPTNVEASALYKNNKKLFSERAKDCVNASIDHVYDEPAINDKHYIAFQPYNPEIHDNAKILMMTPTKDNDEVSQGISWVQQGSFQAFSKDETT